MSRRPTPNRLRRCMPTAAAVLAVFLSSCVAQTARAADKPKPPDASAVLQYVETVPTAGGAVATEPASSSATSSPTKVGLAINAGAEGSSHAAIVFAALGFGTVAVIGLAIGYRRLRQRG